MSVQTETIEITGLPVGTKTTLEEIGRNKGKSAEDFLREIIEAEVLAARSLDEILEPPLIGLPVDVLQALVEKAEEMGVTPEEYARRLVEDGLFARERTFDEILAPFRREVEESGITDEELDNLFMQARRDYHQEEKERL